MVILGPRGHERAMPEDSHGEIPERQGRKGGVERANEVFVEPLGLLYLEANALH
jgi:hypothetical protein